MSPNHGQTVFKQAAFRINREEKSPSTSKAINKSRRSLQFLSDIGHKSIQFQVNKEILKRTYNSVADIKHHEQFDKTFHKSFLNAADKQIPDAGTSNRFYEYAS